MISALLSTPKVIIFLLGNNSGIFAVYSLSKFTTQTGDIFNKESLASK